MAEPHDRLGTVVDGSFNAGLLVRLDPEVSTEDLRIGDFVVVESERYLYFSIVGDIQLRHTDDRLRADPPVGSAWVRDVVRGRLTYALVQVKPMLMAEKAGEDALLVDLSPPQVVRTIPMHLAVLRKATEEDFNLVFGSEGGEFFSIGYPLTMDVPICVNLARLTERSSGIFGQSGTGKSFLVRLLICGIIKSGVAVNLVFDMHDEYAFGKQSEEGEWVKGLTHLFGRGKVLVYSLDEQAASRKGRNVDRTLVIGLNQIEAEDVLLLEEELNLRGTAAATIGLLEDVYKDRWFRQLIEMSPDEVNEFCQQSGAHAASVLALQRALKQVARREYVTESANFNVIDEMVEALEQGKHVILHFGRYDTPLDHMLVANIVTRRVREKYREKTERYEQTHKPEDRPRTLVITLEEAHKFLSPAVAGQTIFGTIAREMRKYHVTLMVVDQRPSGIDAEVLSQLGTRIVGKLTDERDIDAVLTGVSNRSFLRGALESLDTRGQVVVMGHGVPMPVALRTRAYDDRFYEEITKEDSAGSAVQAIEELFEP